VPTEHFRSKNAYRKWNAYRHIHGIPAPHLKTAVVAGKAHKVKHSDKKLGQKKKPVRARTSRKRAGKRA
jgi:hypothetical protein